MTGRVGDTELREPLLLQMRQDRRLGHEWDDWDGRPLPNGGVYITGPGLFFGAAAGAALLCAAAFGVVLWLITPRLGTLHEVVPGIAAVLLLLATTAWFVWLGLLAASLASGRALLPARLADRGVIPAILKPVEQVARLFGVSRDRLGHSALVVFNRLAEMHVAPHTPEDLLILLPRCLSKEAMQTAMRISAKHGVAAFVASRGRYARQMIAERRPRAVVAIACERDLVSGVRDVAHRLPVLGSTLGMPEGPCRNTELDAAAFESQVLAMIGRRGKKPSANGAGAQEQGREEGRSNAVQRVEPDPSQAVSALPAAGREAQPAQ